MDRIVVFDGTAHVETRERPTADAGEVLIRLRTAGICNTDLELMRGYRGFQGILGHEFVGTVIEGPEDWVNQRVVGEINVACGVCDMCRRGVPTHCRKRRVLGIDGYDGAFADVFRLPVANLHRVPDQVADDEAVFTEPLAAACEITEECHIRPSDRVAVLGAGKLGLLIAQVLRLTGADVVAVARRERPAALLAEWGIPVVKSADELPEARADVVVDCTGAPDSLAAAVQLLRPRGTLVLKSTYHGQPTVDMTRVAVDEFRLVGSRCGPFEPALRLLARQLVSVTPMVDAVYELNDAVEALERAAQPGTLKVLLKP